MADVKISALTALTGADVVTSTDVFAIVDMSATLTKKILVDELRIALGIATQAQQETATSLVVNVTPGTQHFHPSAAKGWAVANFVGGAAGSFNVASITDVGTGLVTVVWATDFSAGTYSAPATIESASPWIVTVDSGGRLVGSTAYRVQDSNGTEGDGDAIHVIAFGDQA